MTDPWEFGWPAVSAIGTLVAAIVALVLGLYGAWFRQRIWRPRLEIAPHAKVASANNGTALVVRLVVDNRRGRRDAEGAQVLVERFDPPVGEPIELLLPLQWTNAPMVSVPEHSARVLAHSWRLVDLAAVRAGHDYAVSLQTNPQVPTYDGGQISTSGGAFECTIRLVLNCRGMRPRTFSGRLVYRGGWDGSTPIPEDLLSFELTSLPNPPVGGLPSWSRGAT
jgi:hypothetical protein